MKHSYKHCRRIQKSIPGQSGAVLVMALVLLTVMTLIGVTTMSSSSMEMRVASNMQQHNIAFQGAQSRIEYATAETSVSPINFKINIPNLNAPNTWPVQTCNLVPDGCPDGVDWDATAETRYKGCTRGYGNSLEANKGIATRTFEISVTATVTGGVARSIQGQGVRGTVKNCGDET
jgi:Tfp pilus assembly protein PilX